MPFSQYRQTVPKPLGNKYLQNPVTIGDKIRNRRLELGLLQKDIALKLEVPEETIYRWETNRNTPDMKCMPRIIGFLGYLPIELDTTLLGGKIAQYRYYNGLSQEGLANILGVNESTVFHYEKGTHKPTPSIFRKLTTLLQIP